MAKLVKITKQMALDWGLTEDDPIVGKVVTWYTKEDSTEVINKHANEIYLVNELNQFKKNDKVKIQGVKYFVNNLKNVLEEDIDDINLINHFEQYLNNNED